MMINTIRQKIKSAMSFQLGYNNKLLPSAIISTQADSPCLSSNRVRVSKALKIADDWPLLPPRYRN